MMGVDEPRQQHERLPSDKGSGVAKANRHVCNLGFHEGSVANAKVGEDDNDIVADCRVRPGLQLSGLDMSKKSCLECGVRENFRFHMIAKTYTHTIAAILFFAKTSSCKHNCTVSSWKNC
jgi:hypothetical protein